MVSESATSNIRVTSTTFVATVGDIARALGAILSGAMALVLHPSTIFGMAAIILFFGGLLVGFLRFE